MITLRGESRTYVLSKRESVCLSTEPLHLPADGHDPPIAASFWLSGHRKHQGRLELKSPLAVSRALACISPSLSRAHSRSVMKRRVHWWGRGVDFTVWWERRFAPRPLHHGFWHHPPWMMTLGRGRKLKTIFFSFKTNKRDVPPPVQMQCHRRFESKLKSLRLSQGSVHCCARPQIFALSVPYHHFRHTFLLRVGHSFPILPPRPSVSF